MRVFFEQLELVARHGIYDDERTAGRQFRIDLSVEIPDSKHDRITDTVNYCDLSEIARDVASNEQYHLVETVSREILERVFSRWGDVTSAKVVVRKRAFGVPGSPQWVGVSMTRVRE